MATTTNFGWTTPDDTDLVKDGAAAIRTLGSAIDTSLVDLKGGTTGQILSKASNTNMDFTWAAAPETPGLVFITSSTLTAVANRSINDCFTSAYRNYRILIELVGSVADEVTLRLRASGTDASGTDYFYQRVTGSGNISNPIGFTSQTSWNVGAVGTTKTAYTLDILAPQIAETSAFICFFGRSDFGGSFFGNHRVSTAYDGFTLAIASGNMTGRISIYGYKE